MLFAIDIGNTHVSYGIFKNKELIKTWRISTDVKRTDDEYGTFILEFFNQNGLRKQDIKDIIISSVVPLLNNVFERMSKHYFQLKPLFIGRYLKIDMPILYDNPAEVGSDRIVNAVSAYNKYKGPLIIIDLGTATTLCVVSSRGEYLGGCIAPGLATSAEALYEKTAKLPQIRIRKPRTVLGKDTTSSMQSGLYYGYISLIEGLIQRIQQELREDSKVVITGGFSELLSGDLHDVIIDKNLTLEGLKIIYDKNKNIRRQLHYKK